MSDSSDEFQKRSKTPAFRPVLRVAPDKSPVTPPDKAPDPEVDWGPIDPQRYTSSDFMRREWQAIWSKVWLLGAREIDLTEPGDYVATELGHESILFVRQTDGNIRAFYNVCQHRGNRLRDCGLGKADESQTLKCRYHHWEYNLDGSYFRIPDLDTFPQGKPDYALTAVRCDTWGGFVWYTLDNNAKPLREFLAPIDVHLAPYNFHKMVQTRDITVDWHCNWKASVDAFNESYHVQGIHPQLLWYLNDIDIQIDCYERHSRYLIPFGTLSPRIRTPPSIPDPIKVIMKGAGMDPADYDGKISDIRRDVQRWKRQNSAAQGKDYSQLNDDQLTDDYHYFIFPNLSLNLHADDFWVFRQRPHPTDPDRMFYDIWTFELVPEGTEWPRRAKHQHFKHGDKSIGLVLDQDAANLPSVQAGMHSNGYKGLWLGKQELRLRHFHKVIDDYLRADSQASQ